MKNKTRGKAADYTKLKRRLYWVALAAGGGSLVAAILLRFATIGFSEDIVAFLQRAFRLDFEDARNIFQYGIRENLGWLLPLGLAAFFLVFMAVYTRRLTRYFDVINNQVDAITQGAEPELEMPTELAFLDSRLERLKNTLAQREREAVQAEQRKNELVMYLAHDIKTPLTSVIGYLSLLDEAPDMPTGQKAKYVHITLDKAYRLESLINQFFEITRFTLHEESLQYEQVDLPVMLVQMAEEYYPMLQVQSKTVELHIPDALFLPADAGKLARVFNNLLKNAIAYSFENTAIHITAAAQNGFAVVEVKNKGRAIPQAKLATVFEKFYRMDEARSTHSGGAGLGLAIAKEIVAMHGGTIAAASDEEWTRFTVTLPLHLPQMAAPAAARAKP